jgi:hypothetical protein
MLNASLKLQVIRSPAVMLPEVTGAIARPYGFSSPFTGSIVDPIVTRCFNWPITPWPRAAMDACEDGMTTEAAATLTHMALEATVASMTRLSLRGAKFDTVLLLVESGGGRSSSVRERKPRV